MQKSATPHLMHKLARLSHRMFIQGVSTGLKPGKKLPGTFCLKCNEELHILNSKYIVNELSSIGRSNTKKELPVDLIVTNLRTLSVKLKLATSLNGSTVALEPYSLTVSKFP